MNWRGLPYFNVNLSALVFGTILIAALTKLLHYLPTEYYFSFTGFLYYHDLAAAAPADAPLPQPTHWLSLVIKLAIPIVTGLILGVLWGEDGVKAAGAAGFAGAFLLCWPAIVEWDVLANPVVFDRKNQFLLLFAAYIGSFSYLCLAASRIGPGVRQWVTRHLGGPFPNELVIDWNKVATELVKSAALAALSFVIGYVAK